MLSLQETDPNNECELSDSPQENAVGAAFFAPEVRLDDQSAGWKLHGYLI